MTLAKARLIHAICRKRGEPVPVDVMVTLVAHGIYPQS